MNTNIIVQKKNYELYISFSENTLKDFIEFADDIITYLKQTKTCITIDISNEDSIDSLVVGKMIKIIKISREYQKNLIFIISEKVEETIKLTSLDNIIKYELQNDLY